MLDVGAGSGYLTSVLYRLVGGGGVGSGGTVIGIEHIPALTTLAERNIRADGLGDAIDEQGIVLLTSDGRLGASWSLLPLPYTTTQNWRALSLLLLGCCFGVGGCFFRVRGEGSLRRDSRRSCGEDGPACARGAAREPRADGHSRRDVFAEADAGRQGCTGTDHPEGPFWRRGASSICVLAPGS